jgi:hypothetical protein
VDTLLPWFDCSVGYHCVDVFLSHAQSVCVEAEGPCTFSLASLLFGQCAFGTVVVILGLLVGFCIFLNSTSS